MHRRLGRRTVAGALALTVVAAGCAHRSAPSLGGTTAGAPRTNRDHWHAAFGIYVCDRYLPALPAFESPAGIHTHGDGVIHIHPFTRAAAGDNARLGVFLRGAGIDLGDGRVTVGGTTFRTGHDCGGRPAAVELVRWRHAEGTGGPQVVTHDAARLRFTADGEGYAVAVVPEGTEVPKPPSTVKLAALRSGEETPTTGGRTDGSPPVAAGFHPVRADQPATGPTCPAGRLGDGQGRCYQVGDEHAVGLDAVASARVSDDRGQPGVDVTLTPDGLGNFNLLAAGCYNRVPACATGRVALVVDGAVVFAPTIANATFDSPDIRVSGSFDKDRADAIAAAMGGG